MSQKIAVKSVNEQPAMVIRTTVKENELGEVMGKLFPKLMQFVHTYGLQMLGAPYALYHSFSPEAVDFECGIPVAASITGEGDIQPGAIPPGTVATTMHLGTYDTLSDTYKKLGAWMTAQGYSTNNICWENYITDPQEVQNSAEWQTEINWLIE